VEARRRRSGSNLGMARPGRRSVSSFYDLDPQTATRVAYQVVLGREPDEPGLAAYAGRLASGELTHRDLCEALLGSTEFAIRWHTRIWAGRRGELGDQPVVGTLADGGTILLAPWDLLISDVIRTTGVWEPDVTALVRRVVRAGSVVVDVGANVGYFTVLAAGLVGPAGRVVAFEPSPANVQLLLGSVVANGFTNVDVWPLALSDRHVVLPLHTDDVSTNATLVTAGDASSTWVVGARGDDLLTRVEPTGSCLVKIDVEGFEHSVLLGMTNFLRRHRPTVVLEFNPRFIQDGGADADEQLAWLYDRATSVGLLVAGGQVELLPSAADVMARWRRRNDDAGQDGVLHLDLVATFD
jgi:FkbM family methyltransferase